MKRRSLGASGIEASVLGLGTWAIGGFLWGGTDEKRAIEAIHASLDEGVTLFDTAPAYGFGLAEELLGRALRGRRGDVVIATKCGLVWDEGSLARVLREGRNPLRRCLRPESIRKEVEASLRRLRTDYIDLYQTHWPDFGVPIEDTMGALLELQEEGKIRAIGVCNVSVEQLRKYLRVGRVDADQERYSMLDCGQEKDKWPVLKEHGIAFLAYSPLSMGLLTGRVRPEREFPEGDLRRTDPRFHRESRERIARMLSAMKPAADRHGATIAQWVLAWTLAQPGVTHVLVGARDGAQARENARAAALQLSPEELRATEGILAAHVPGIPSMGW